MKIPLSQRIKAHRLTVTAAAFITLTAGLYLSTIITRPINTPAAEDVGRRCIAKETPLSECILACSEVDRWYGQPCASAARRAALGDAGPALTRSAEKGAGR